MIPRPEIGDLVRHKDDGSLWLSRITDIDINGFCSVTDEAILRNADNHILSETGIGHMDIIQNYGNITLEQFREDYPEWTI